NEPDVVSEAIESIQEEPAERSKHQKFMASLATSGKSFADIQTEWHQYYEKLPDKEKHEVWNEFYSAQGNGKPYAGHIPSQQPSHPVNQGSVTHQGFINPNNPSNTKPQSVADLKQKIISKVDTRGKLSRQQHLKSLLFGLGVGAFTVCLLLFGFFNERFIAPFITPSKNVSSTPLISNGITGAVGSDPKLIIPKINVELPVVYDVKTVEEADVQEGLERGVVHYVTTANPGEKGNGAIFGHSSNNILNKGKYKFAFVLLSRLEENDTFYIEKDGVRYVYKIFKKEVVTPSNVSVLNAVPGKESTMALITCDPPGTTLNRLVVWGEQISPDPTNNLASTAPSIQETPETLAGNPQSLWSRMWNWIF
ncbi:sortase, partial [Candidatus Saccharibacteria bacterium]|nr:sortase [Candidatus Saccharibacteria bacterium]